MRILAKVFPNYELSGSNGSVVFRGMKAASMKPHEALSPARQEVYKHFTWSLTEIMINIAKSRHIHWM